MASKSKTKTKAPKTQKSDKKGESDGFMHGLLTVLLSILIVLVIFGGAFYYVLKNNIYGIGEQFRPALGRIPVIKMALPPLPETEDPDDPKHLTQSELLMRYNALRSTRTDLTEQLDNAQQRIQQLEQEREQWVHYKEEAQAIQQENEQTLAKLQEQKAQMEQDKNELAKLIAQGDTEGFREYFERIEQDAAKEIYQQLVKQDLENQQFKTMAKTYTEMEPANAAVILTELGKNDMPLVINLIGAMKADIAAEILESMEPTFAAELMQKQAEKELGG